MSKKIRGVDGRGLGRPEFGIHPKLFSMFGISQKNYAHPNLIPKIGVVQFCPALSHGNTPVSEEQCL